MKLINKIVKHRKALVAYLFFIDNLATGHFWRKFSPYVSLSGHTGSNDTGLMFVSYPKQNKDIII
jgi:hypothetical protein